MTGAFPSLDGVALAGKRVLLRADLNVPLSEGRITDATRITRFAPGLRNLLDRGAAVVVVTHLGRPRGEPNPGLSVKPLTGALAAALGQPVGFAPDCVGQSADRAIGRLEAGDVTLLENLRFHAGEEKNDTGFALKLAVHGDIYVNDAFSCAHRAHASTEAVTHYLPSYAGPLMEAELNALSRALEMPERPVAALVGDAKVSTKIAVLKHLLPRMDVLVIGGGMANTFLLAEGKSLGRSLAEPNQLEVAREIMARADRADCRLLLPEDVVVAERLEAGAPHQVCPADAVPPESMILDVGPKAAEAITQTLSACRTLLWNGPLGAFETKPFDQGSVTVARAAAELTRSGRLVTVAGGGDTVAALNAAGVTEDFSYVSLAGGAFLEWLEGKDLPGIAALANMTQQLKEA